MGGRMREGKDREPKDKSQAEDMIKLKGSECSEGMLIISKARTQFDIIKV